MSPPPAFRHARWVNLLVPGGGALLLGDVWTGAGLALLFIASVNLALVAAVIFPEDFSAATRATLLILPLAIYVLAQVRLAQTLRRRQRLLAAARRREALWATRRFLREGRVEHARQALASIADRAENDLLVALRLAQVLTAAGECAKARLAWEHVRRLDRHRLYRQTIAAAEQVLLEAENVPSRHAALTAPGVDFHHGTADTTLGPEPRA